MKDKEQISGYQKRGGGMGKIGKKDKEYIYHDEY